jgi:hypothetical protein
VEDCKELDSIRRSTVRCARVDSHLVFPNSNSTVEQWRRTCKLIGNPFVPFPSSSIHRAICQDTMIQILQLSILSESRAGQGACLENRAMFVFHFEALRLQHLWGKYDSEKHLQECFSFNMLFIGLRTMASAECLALWLEDLINIMGLFTVSLAL